jgi:hypothetical protein
MVYYTMVFKNLSYPGLESFTFFAARGATGKGNQASSRKPPGEGPDLAETFKSLIGHPGIQALT